MGGRKTWPASLSLFSVVSFNNHPIRIPQARISGVLTPGPHPRHSERSLPSEESLFRNAAIRNHREDGMPANASSAPRGLSPRDVSDIVLLLGKGASE